MPEEVKAQRNTPQKATIRDALADCDGFVSAQELHQRIVASGQAVGLATVYRNLNELAEQGSADVVQTSTGTQLFHFCGEVGHHHHLVCVSCGRSVEIEAPLEEWLGRVTADNGFTLERHVLDVFGVCSDCRKAAAS